MFKDYRAFVGTWPERWYKTTLFQSPRMLVGLDCLEPGQEQHIHKHAGRDKCYFVIEGQGRFSVGDATYDAAPGAVVWAAADIPHGVVNTGTERLVMLITMAPEPG